MTLTSDMPTVLTISNELCLSELRDLRENMPSSRLETICELPHIQLFSQMSEVGRYHSTRGVVPSPL